jgi:multiple sugar transport system permease protein
MELRLMTTRVVMIFMLDFIRIWNDFFLPLFMLTGDATFPVTLGLYAWNAQLLSARDVPSLVITGSFLLIIPLALFMFSPQTGAAGSSRAPSADGRLLIGPRS